MDKISTFLWYDGKAEEAARFYCSLFADSGIDTVTRAPGDYPAGKEGDALVVSFTLAGRSYEAMNGGPGHPFTDAISLSVTTEDQAETDRLWDALTADGGEGIACSWLKDRYGLRWQICPRVLSEALSSPDRAAAGRAFTAMMGMVKIDVAAIERAIAGDDA